MTDETTRLLASQDAAISSMFGALIMFLDRKGVVERYQFIAHLQALLATAESAREDPMMLKALQREVWKLQEMRSSQIN